MIKWAVIWTLLAASIVANENKVDNFFEDYNSIMTPDGLQCSRLEGSSSECLACYNCEHDKIVNAKKKVIKKLQFSYSNCTKDELCCVFAADLQARSSDTDCGKHNPQGNPRVPRPSLRKVLEREYPWRAWVYGRDLEKPLCSASYIDLSTNALLTTASCVSGYQASALRVKFTKTQQTPYLVREVVIHEQFATSTGGNSADIALLFLAAKPEKRVRNVCIESKQVPAASECVIVSDSDHSINVIVPRLTKCVQENVHVDNNVTCSYMIGNDYIPERGAGLYCLSEHFDPPAYIIQGIYQSYQNSGPVALYTSVGQYTQWITRTTERIRKTRH